MSSARKETMANKQFLKDIDKWFKKVNEHSCAKSIQNIRQEFTTVRVLGDIKKQIAPMKKTLAERRIEAETAAMKSKEKPSKDKYARIDKDDPEYRRKEVRNLTKYLNDYAQKFSQQGGSKNIDFIDKDPNKKVFLDANGKTIVDPTAVNQEAGLEIDSNEYLHLLRMLELDPNGTKINIYNMDNVNQ